MDRRILLVTGVLGALLLISFVANVLPRTESVRLGLLILQQLLFAVAGLLGSCRQKLKLQRRGMVAWGVLAGVGIYLVNRLTGILSQGIALELFSHELVQNLILRENGAAEALLTSDNPLIFFGMVLLLTIGTPVGEELFFRGLLLNLWKERFGAKKAVFFSALIFALLHFSVLQFVPLLIAGILLGMLLVRSESIAVPMIAHCTVNSLVLILWF
ncbi:MAG: CPBP family intramembrane metalloprotease [Limnochordia bacterium]|nr:CPBP family intramembrane metalloprotease [Limnochordia bacterium]